jgi:GNAT superfamily N-acetyltransferase
MINFASYRKLGILNNGRRVVLHLPREEDWENLEKLFQEAPSEDTRFLKENLKDQNQICTWEKNMQNRKTILLMAEDLEKRRVIGAAQLNRGKDASIHIGDVRDIFVSRPYQKQGLGSLMLEELLNLAAMEHLHWLKTEVVIDQKDAVSAFLRKGFAIKVILDDFFLSQDGATYDVAFMTRPVREASRVGEETEF